MAQSTLSTDKQLIKKPSASNIANAQSLASPLTQLSLHPSSRYPESSSTVPSSAIPPIEFNLFRSNSVYSTSSLESNGTISPERHSIYGTLDRATEDEEEDGPVTPRATDSNSGAYFNAANGSSSSSAGRSTAPLTPKSSFVVHRPHAPVLHTQTQLTAFRSTALASDFQLRPVPGRTRKASIPNVRPRESPAPLLPETQAMSDRASVHGEQGSEWGEDEGTFEWVDNESGAEASNGAPPTGRLATLSPGKKLARLVPHLRAGPHEGRKLRKPLVFPRRAAPPPPESLGQATSPPRDRLLSIPTSPTTRKSSIKKAISHPGKIGLVEGEPSKRPDILQDNNRQQIGETSHGHLMPRSESLQASQNNLPTDVFSNSRMAGSTSRSTMGPTLRVGSSNSLNVPTMVPMKSGENDATTDRNKAHMSIQSVAYSFYDLDGAESQSPSTPTANSTSQRTTPTGSQVAFPRGRYTKVSASALEHEANKERERERTMSEPSGAGMGDGGRTPDDFVKAGIEARGNGDYARSAWYFLKAAEGGSPTGRMYWGLSLRHGWGVARDDNKAFIELRQACDESLAEGGLDIRQSPGHVKLTTAQQKSITKDLSVGLFEIANCFLDGVGVKKAPTIGISYLRFAANMGDLASQEQLGHLLSKGSNGVKKDMKEAAKWYRMAISQGSGTFGLAWVWKDKYMT